ncbi:hypothetical protein [Shimia sp. SK013]|uniref:hypothetical protein n=1 Tax=Shimia sp. SK013 TaxID=1389006 RepID=UPI0006B537D6|nr:hypothetical protein [Shimia sp. SK013]
MLGLLSGCAPIGPEFEKPEIGLPDKFLKESATPARKNDATWWTAYNDSILNQIVEYGLKNNKDVQRLAARILQSQGILESSGFPLSGALKVGEAKLTTDGGEVTTTTSFARPDSTWKLALSGRLQRECETAIARPKPAMRVWTFGVCA